MRLKAVQVKFFRHIIDSSPVAIQSDVTCLVGKNESGKTAFLQALWRFNPANGKPSMSIGSLYPAWLEKKHRNEGMDLEEHPFVTCTFTLDDTDRSAVNSHLGDSAFTATEIQIAKRYSDRRVYYGLTVDERKCVAKIIDGVDLPLALAEEVKGIATLDALKSAAAPYAKGDFATVPKQIDEAIDTMLGDSETVISLVVSLLEKRLPKFFYFGEYSILPDVVKIKDVLAGKKADLAENLQTARALLDMAGAEKDYLENPDYNTRRRELENVANAITADVLEYWTTNVHLRTFIDIQQKTVHVPPNNHQAVVDELHVRMYDNEHMLSLPFGERSSGFQWFFSFLVAFSEYERAKGEVVILLDEPGLGLHARAQKDFLRFIDERLSKRQVLYSTHSPFMVQPKQLERVRLVEDKGKKLGSVISSDVLTTDADTLFPLQGALGYDIAQNLLVTQHNLIVEGPSDYIYLTQFSDRLEQIGKVGLDSRITIIPVGGADLIPTFVALLGNHLDVSVLVDSRRGGHQRLSALTQAGILKDTRLIMVGEIAGIQVADIEDLFDPTDYLRIYNSACGKSLAIATLQGTDSIVNKIARAEGVQRFNHNRPAEQMMRDPALIVGSSQTTITNFERLIQRINQTFPAA